MATRRNREFWRRVVSEYKASGQTAPAFAAARKLNLGTLRWWVSHLRRDDRAGTRASGAGFVEVTCASGPLVVAAALPLAESTPPVTVRVGAGVVLAFAVLPPAEYVAQVARCYEAVSP